MALSHPWFLPWPLLAFPVTCNDLTWEGGCSTAGWLQGLFWVCRPGVTLSSYRWLFPSVTDPTQGLCFGTCLSLYQELLAFTTFSLVVPQSRKASFQLLSAPGLQTVWNNEGFAGFTCGQLYLMKISWGFLNNTVFKITKIQSLQILLWTFHSHAQTVLHVLCRQGEIISKETLYAFLDDILLLPYCFFFFAFFSFLLHHILILSLPPLETDGELVVLMSSLLPREGGLKCFVLWELTGWAPSLRM